MANDEEQKRRMYTGNPLRDLPADEVLRGAIGKLDDVVICGYDKNGNVFFAVNRDNRPLVLWMLEECKRALFELPPIETPPMN